MTASPPDLTIVIPFYDETAFLRMAVRSVLAQGLAAEVIVVNDNPDRFGPDDIAALDLPGAVQVLHHPRNLGLSSARNTGMAAARGKWIGFLDADDYYLNDGLAAQMHLARTSGADMVQANCLLTRHGLPDLQPLERETALFARPNSGAGLKGLEEAQFITSSWSSLYRRGFLADNGLMFDPEQIKFEDRLFVLQTVTAARRIAVLGQASRVWRRRTGSISVSGADAAVLRLQVQLLEKCLAHMRGFGSGPDVPQRFWKRETFNTVSRLIWDIDVVAALAEEAPGVAELGPRVMALMAECTLGQQIFDDPVVRKISRVGMKTRKGMIRRVDFFVIARAMREGDFAQAAALMAARRPAVAARTARVRSVEGRRLVLHLGMHKTGSTALQALMSERQGELRREGVLFPRTGLAMDHAAVRAQGFPGHLGLLEAARRDNDIIWRELRREVADAGCDTVVISCENMLLPLTSEREAVIAHLMARFRGFRSVDVVMFVRRPDVWAEMFFRELVANGNRLGARTLEEFLVDFGGVLTDLPSLLAPFEAATGNRVRLLDYDAATGSGTLWQALVQGAGLSVALCGADGRGAAVALCLAGPGGGSGGAGVDRDGQRSGPTHPGLARVLWRIGRPRVRRGAAFVAKGSGRADRRLCGQVGRFCRRPRLCARPCSPARRGHGRGLGRTAGAANGAGPANHRIAGPQCRCRKPWQAGSGPARRDGRDKAGG